MSLLYLTLSQLLLKRPYWPQLDSVVYYKLLIFIVERLDFRQCPMWNQTILTLHTLLMWNEAAY